jgi:DNA-directed RNA polymerase specialized sigma24 family protein
VGDRPEYDRFVAERSPRLLRVAYLMTRDWAAAEDLLQSALVKAWFAWSKVDGDAEAYVRRISVTTHVSLRRRRWTGEVRHEESLAGWSDRAAHVADPAGAYAERDALWRARPSGEGRRRTRCLRVEPRAARGRPRLRRPGAPVPHGTPAPRSRADRATAPAHHAGV